MNVSPTDTHPVPGVYGWQDGNPPRADWFYTRRFAEQAHWRWWDGRQWSSPVPEGATDEMAQRITRTPALGRYSIGQRIQWWRGDLGPIRMPSYVRCAPIELGHK